MADATHIVGQLFNVAMGSVGIILSMTNHEKIALTGHLAGLATLVTLALILIPIYQQIGAAIAVSSSLLVWNIVLASVYPAYTSGRTG